MILFQPISFIRRQLGAATATELAIQVDTALLVSIDAADSAGGGGGDGDGDGDGDGGGGGDGD